MNARSRLRAWSGSLFSHRRFPAMLFVATLLALPCRTSATTLDQSFVSPTNAIFAMITGQQIGQTYTPGITGTLAGVNLDISFCLLSQGCTPISDTTHPMQISIYDTVNGLPTTLLGSTTLPPGQAAPLSLLITFPQVITETAGDQHAIVVNFPGSQPPGPCPPTCPFPNNGLWRGSNLNSYADGELVLSLDGGASWFAPTSGPGGPPGFDLHFQTHVLVASVPEPGTLLLLGTGLLGIAGSVWRPKRRALAETRKRAVFHL